MSWGWGCNWLDRNGRSVCSAAGEGNGKEEEGGEMVKGRDVII